MLEKIKALILLLIGLPALMYVLLLGSSGVYVSGGLGRDVLEDKIENPNPVWKSIKKLNLPGLKNPGVTVVPEVHAGHAIRNIVFIFCTAAVFGLIPLALFVVGILVVLFGFLYLICTFKFGDFLAICGSGICFMILSPLSIIVCIIGIIAMYVGLLFMPCTAGYATLWVIFGLPLTLLGGGGSAVASKTIIIIILDD